MMFSDNYPAVRILMKVTGGLIVVGLLATGLGWLLAKNPKWVGRQIGVEETNFLRRCYASVLDRVATNDSDGDGVRDWMDWFEGTWVKEPGIIRRVSPVCVSHWVGVGFCGERQTLRWAQNTGLGARPWPRGFRAIVTARSPVLSSSQTDAPTVGPLSIGTNANGELEFGVLANEIYESVPLVLSNERTGNELGRWYFHFPGWRTTAIPVSVDGKAGPLPYPKINGFNDIWEHEARWNVPADWPDKYLVRAYQRGRGAYDPGPGSFVIEARVGRGSDWEIVGESPRFSSVWRFNNRIWEHFFATGHRPLEFRAIPVRDAPPQRED